MKRENFWNAVRQIETECANEVAEATNSTLKMGSRLQANGYNEFYMLNDEGEPYFGLDFTVKYSHFYSTDPDELMFNIGTMGEFNDEHQVNLYTVFSKVISSKDIQQIIIDSILKIRNLEAALED